MSQDAAKTEQRPPPGEQPLIPESFLDVPSQRLYYLSFGLLCQAIKIFDFFQYLFLADDGRHTSYARKWIVVDFLYCTCLAALRIPRLNYTKSVVVLQIILLWLLDGLFFGGLALNVNFGGSKSVPSSVGAPYRAEVTTDQTFSFSNLLPSFGLGSLLGFKDGHDPHLQGQHTVRMSPISTARLNPYTQTFCIAAPGQSILIPVLFNNTSPTSLKYSLAPLGYVEDPKEQANAKTGRIEYFELGTKDMKAIEQARVESLQVAKTAASTKRDIDYDEYDEEDDDDDSRTRGSSLQKSQTLMHIRLNKPGTLRLERVLDSNVEARLVYPNEVTVAPCPGAEFTSDRPTVSVEENVRCAPPGLTSGSGEVEELKIDVYGVPPLSLRWYREINGKREAFMVEGIEGDVHPHLHTETRRTVGVSRTPQQLTVPLTVTLDALGTHDYVLDSVTDGLGNVVAAGIGSSGATSSPMVPAESTRAGSLGSKTRRSFIVLRRPNVSFKHCGPGNPSPLLIGSETPLTIATHVADHVDSPWNVTVQYRPAAADSKRHRPWTQVLTTQKDRKELTVRANAPGEYAIVGVKGRYCDGDVLSPETCKVVERPLPTAAIEWKKIHECSGDTGVSASLVLHGTPPFQVYYTMQKDKEPARETVKTFPSSRGELTIQPERSGHYTFTFTRISDANYKKVELKGPSIDQVVHPPASAEFVQAASGKGKKRINSCSGNLVDVDIELRGTGPWSLEMQVVGPKGSEIVKVPNITSSRKTVQVPIPAAIDKDGGTFEIDLVSVEDAYGCKRTLSVPGIAVNVRRVQPTAKFYGPGNKRQVTILEGEVASLPLRLTGDGPWRLKYRRAEDPKRDFTATLSNPNDQLRVNDKGLYELVEIADSQCPGSVITDSATYQVDWVPRPSAKLSPETPFTYEPFNGSHILPPICEGLPDHVDLDLTGRPPFQIMYNVATDGENGATRILDQPTFSSIQPHTRFQLHSSEPARIYYEVKQIGDAAYPLSKHKDAMIPRSERLVFEQQVLRRPSARFTTSNRISYCLGDTFSPRDSASADGLIVLEGTPPFYLDLSVKNLAASEVHKETVELHDATWKLDLPSYTFKSIGPHLVTIESLRDASQCEQTIPDPLSRSIWVDVAETAAIVPFDRREHFCVGEATQFQLEGTPPWTIGYRLNGKSHVQEAKTSPLSIVQKQPGEFVITSIAHQQKMCKTAVTDLRYIVHPLPSAQVGHGKRVIQDIHEGDQAEIVFTLTGEPPFTFTYQRAELSSKKGTPGKVLETHTVSGVTTKEYSIFSALEGTWTVTFVSDKYCRYPPVRSETAGRSK